MKKLIAIIITFIFIFEGVGYCLRVPMYFENHRAGIAAAWDENHCNELGQKIVNTLGLLPLEDYPVYDTHLTYGPNSYGRQRFSIKGQKGFCFVRIGYLFFLDEKLYKKLDDGLRIALGANVILIANNQKGYMADWASNEFTMSTMVAIIGNDFGNKRIIDAGAGDGILSIVALKLGAISVDLIENISENLIQAEELLKLNGYSLGVHYHIHSVDLKDTSIVVDRLKSTEVDIDTVIICNIGYWPQWEVNNAYVIKMIPFIPRVKLFISGGYVESQESKRFMYINQEEIKKFDFQIDDAIVTSKQDEDVIPVVWVARKISGSIKELMRKRLQYDSSL